jgi:hypothetical protein
MPGLDYDYCSIGEQHTASRAVAQSGRMSEESRKRYRPLLVKCLCGGMQAIRLVRPPTDDNELVEPGFQRSQHSLKRS